jgi:WD40 repeat protein
MQSSADDKELFKFIFEFSDHASSVNAVKFSPCGKHMATASDRQIVVYSGMPYLS